MLYKAIGMPAFCCSFRRFFLHPRQKMHQNRALPRMVSLKRGAAIPPGVAPHKHEARYGTIRPASIKPDTMSTPAPSSQTHSAPAPLLVLGFESSCDETGVAVVDTAGRLRGQALHSQIAMHRDYGGVVPELASRDHIRRLQPLLDEALQRAQCTLQDIAAIAVTVGPGLPGALLSGASFATALGMALNIPVLPVHHLEGHLLSPLLSDNPPDFPFTALR